MNPGGDGNQIRKIQQDQTQLLRIDGSEVPLIHQASHPGGPLHQQDTMAVHLPDVEIVVYPGILVPRNYLSWQKIFGKMLTLNCKIDYNVR